MSKTTEKLRNITTLESLVDYLRDDMNWPIEAEDFEDIVFEYTPEELGIDEANAARIESIRRLRPLDEHQPWGVFFVEFEPRKLPVTTLRRILREVVTKKRASANKADRVTWDMEDLMFISCMGGDGSERAMNFAHFSQGDDGRLPSLKVVAWDSYDTPLHMEDVSEKLTEKLAWPDNVEDTVAWREVWGSAFTLHHGQVIKTSKKLAVLLADLARDIHDRVLTTLEIEDGDGAITDLLKAFQKALLHDLDAEGFADMYAQTISYGLLSARIVNPSHATGSRIELPVTNPFLRDLMDTFLHAGGDSLVDGGAGIDFDELGVNEIIDLLDNTDMEAVVIDFGDKNPAEDPVIHFYQDFLKEYDAQLKVERGVFYTPRPVVSYIVRSVHEILKTEFALEDGLADTTTWGGMAEGLASIQIPEGVDPAQPFVRILDPATGTGTFLVEVIDVVHTTLTKRWASDGKGAGEIAELWNEYVPNHLLPRLYGYELLMAPYAIAHLKIGLKLLETGYRFGSDERAHVYLTNALEPAIDSRSQFEFAIPALAHESSAVNSIKAVPSFTVVVGNPPYSGHSVNNQIQWIVDKVYDYKREHADLQKPGQAKWLQDDYVKFLRLAQWLVETSGAGAVGFITNHAWLDNPTFKGMRKSLLEVFDSATLVDLHGNANQRETAPDGSDDKNVFDIRQGVAISLLAKTTSSERSVVRADVWGSRSQKYSMLAVGLARDVVHQRFTPLPPEYILEPLDEDLQQEFSGFAPIPEIMNQNGDPAPGIVTTQDQFAISFTAAEQIEKVKTLLGTSSEAEARQHYRLCTQNQWNYDNAVSELRETDWEGSVTPILYRPFDIRWTVYDRHVAVHRRERASRHLIGNSNIALITVRQVAEGVFNHALVSDTIAESRITTSNKGIGFVLPLWLEPQWPDTAWLPNVSPRARTELAALTGLRPVQFDGLTELGNEAGSGDLEHTFGPRDVLGYCYAILHAPSYRGRYAPFLKSGFPRIPLTPTQSLFRDLVHLGERLIRLHLTYKMMDGPPDRYFGPPLPEVGRVAWSDGVVWLDAGRSDARRGHRATEPGTFGVAGVAEEVWDFRMCGYQVCHKWLSDRKGRRLKDPELRRFQSIVSSVQQTIDTMDEIDSAIRSHGGWPGAFPVSDTRTPPVAQV